MMLRLAPWLHPIGVRHESLVISYAHEVENRPGDMQDVITISFDWCRCIAVLVPHVIRRCKESVEEAHARLMRIAYLRQHRAPSELPVRESIDVVVALHRTHGEMSYCARLAALQTFAWRKFPIYREEAIYRQSSIIRAEFRYLPRSVRSYVMQNVIREEWRWRTRTGYFVPYQNTEIERIVPAQRKNRYVPIPD